MKVSESWPWLSSLRESVGMKARKVKMKQSSSVVSSLKMWIKKPNPPTPFPEARWGGILPSPRRRGVGGEVFGGCLLLIHNFSLDTPVVA